LNDLQCDSRLAIAIVRAITAIGEAQDFIRWLPLIDQTLVLKLFSVQIRLGHQKIQINYCVLDLSPIKSLLVMSDCLIIITYSNLANHRLVKIADSNFNFSPIDLQRKAKPN